MNSPNFTAAAADQREIADIERWRAEQKARRAEQRRKWAERPMRDDEKHVHGELVLALRGLYSDYSQSDVCEWLHDHYAGEGATAEFMRLMKHVADEEPQLAWDELSRSLELVAKWKREDELSSYEDFDCRR